MDTRVATLQLLGPPRAHIAGTELRFPDRKGAALLALLALDGPATRARVAALLWDEQGDSDVRRNLRRSLHRLREAGFEPLLDAGGDLLALRDGLVVDSVTFETACRAGDHAAALAAYPAALLEGFEVGGAPAFDDWLAARRDTLAQQWRASAERHGDALQAAGEPRAALTIATRLLADDTLHEAHYRRAMALHAGLGEREAALALYERCRRALGRELGLRPLPLTVELADRIRSGAAGVAVPQSSAPSAPSASQPAADASAAMLPALQTLPVTAPLVGREAAIQALHQSLRTQRLTVLEGAAGMGKTRLLQATLAWLASPGVHVHDTRIGDRRVPYAALVRWLRAGLAAGAGLRLDGWVRTELARLLPELGPAPSVPVAPVAAAAAAVEGQRLRLYEAAREAWALAFAGATLHAFDDWHFVDAASAQWWAWWLGQGEHLPTVLLAQRPGEAGPEAAQALQEMLAGGGGTLLQVVPLANDAVYRLIRQLSGSEHPARFAHRLAQATGGHPFYLLETLQHLLQTGVVRVDERGQWHTPFDDATDDYRELPVAPSVQAAVMQRLHTLDAAAQRLLEAASLVDDDFSLALVSGATALDDWEAVHALEAALHARVLARVDPVRSGVSARTPHPAVTAAEATAAAASGERRHQARFRFEHDLFAQAVAAGLSPERRGLMHRALAARLAQDGAAPARVAEHYAAAGDRESAGAWHLRALDAAQRRLRPADMLAHAQRVLDLTSDAVPRVRALLAQATALRVRAEPAAAGQAVTRALALLTTEHPLALRALATAVQAQYLHVDNRTTEALSLLAALLAEPGLEPEDKARLLVRRSTCLRGLGRQAESRADLGTALACLGDEPSVLMADVLDEMARTAVSAGDFAGGLAFAQRAAQVASAEDHAALHAGGLMMCGVACVLSGRFQEAIDWLEQSRAVAAQAGLIANERGAILNLASALLAQGERARALLVVEEGYALSRQFSMPAEQQAFLEARYQCRVDTGQLGLAFDSRDELVAWSLALTELDRRLSGLLTTLDLPLTLGDAPGARAAMAAVLGAIGPADAAHEPEFVGLAFAKAAWLAWLEGDLALARQHLASAELGPRSRPEGLALSCAVRIWVALADGDVHDARAARDQADDSECSAEVRAVLLSAASAVPGSPTSTLSQAAWAARAEAALASGTLPALSTLVLMDALDTAAPRVAGRTLAATLHRSLARRPHEHAAFARRFERWL